MILRSKITWNSVRAIALIFVLFMKHEFLLGQIIDDSTKQNLKYPIQNNIDPTQTKKQSFDLGDPTIVKRTIVYDPKSGTYVFKEDFGDGLF